MSLADLAGEMSSGVIERFEKLLSFDLIGPFPRLLNRGVVYRLGPSNIFAAHSFCFAYFASDMALMNVVLLN